ncbi:MAG: 50S ribosomal protein L17 [Bacteroidetes bacterium]|nr:50S ribosomal protein L17 [Fibrella sp.]
MRHGKKHNHLSRTHSHREAMLSNMASSLILHKRIETTVAKAKALRKFVEPILTRSKEDNDLNRKITFRDLQDVPTMKELFGIVADRIASRPGGYTRIIKLGNRAGDNAETCLIELVDFNETLLSATEEKATKTRRSRRGGGGKKADTDGDFATTVESTPVAVAAVPTAEAQVEAADLTPIVGEPADVTPTTEEADVDAAETDTTPSASTDEAADEDKPKQS